MSTTGDMTSQHHTDQAARLERLEDGSVVVRAAGKVNLTLAVGAKRGDGYHRFESLMTTVTLYDELVISEGEPGICLTCNDPSVPTDDRNLVHRACSLLSWSYAIKPSLRIELRKRIPSQAGLGGGSSDAAACLTALETMWDLGASRERLMEIASQLGSDVGFFLNGPLAICEGRGEVVWPVGDRFDFYAVLVQGDSRLSTGEVYRAHRLSDRSCFGLAEEFRDRIGQGTAEDLSQLMQNDLEAAALRVDDRLGVLKSELEELGSRPVRLSGSGSVLFSLFDTERQAMQWAHRITTSYPELSSWVVRNNLW